MSGSRRPADTHAGKRPAALLLTGGASRRMGRDKAALVVPGRDRTLAVATAALLLAVADPVFEVGPGHTTLPRIREDPPGRGPLAAMAAGAAGLGPATAALVVATDLPHLTAPFLRRLAEHPAPTPDHCVIPYDCEGRPQPLCARYSPAALALTAELTAAGFRAMHALLDRVPITPLAAGDDVRDVDTPADLAALVRPVRR
ncbi:MAG TPA: NTP transferase domain-containing protein [Acidimicrobiales bacterium]|nr:NTP transferase domain-containing protein [Acidimicrobiales bacterium]